MGNESDDGTHSSMAEFVSLIKLLHDNAEDDEAMARALMQEEFNRAQELSGLSEDEFVYTLERIDELISNE